MHDWKGWKRDMKTILGGRQLQSPIVSGKNKQVFGGAKLAIWQAMGTVSA